jgi:acyl carrier protein
MTADEKEMKHEGSEEGRPVCYGPGEERGMNTYSDHMHPSAPNPTLEQDVARLLVQCLELEVRPEDIAPDAPLFNEGLGLDSIDALELALAISREFGFELKSDDERNGRIFASLRSLTAFIETHRTR